MEGRLATVLRKTKTSGPTQSEGAPGRYFGARLLRGEFLAKGGLQSVENAC